MFVRGEQATICIAIAADGLNSYSRSAHPVRSRVDRYIARGVLGHLGRLRMVQGVWPTFCRGVGSGVTGGFPFHIRCTEIHLVDTVVEQISQTVGSHGVGSTETHVQYVRVRPVGIDCEAANKFPPSHERYFSPVQAHNRTAAS